MDSSTWFDDLPVLGNMPPEEAAVKLREMGEEETAGDEWVYLPAKGLVVKRDDHQELIPYNYLVFGISRYEGRRHP